MSIGGKRLRPVLSLMACRLFSDDITHCIRPALAIELFHNFTLLHDDIMDKADMRRGRPTVHKKWCENTAILSGDVMVVLSFDLISSAKLDILPRLLSVFNRTAIEVCEGQQMDMNFETTPLVDEHSYLEMIKLKTSVLIAASMEIGAIAAGASTEDSGLLYESGLNLGLAFQLQDDVLDLYGDQDKFGKKPGGDILMNKKTILLIKALEMADEKTAKKITKIMEEEKDPEIKVSEIKRIFDQLEIQEAADRIANDYFQKALRKLDDTSCKTERKKEFAGFIETVMKRKS
jgi:geranylgeranyl diphosphate synthase, type II